MDKEYVATGQSYGKAADAASALEKRLQDVEKKVLESNADNETSRKSRHTYADLKSIVATTVEGSMPVWEQAGLDRSFYRFSEDTDENAYRLTLSFIHPAYDPVWLTGPQGKNVGKEMIPFLQYTIGVDRKQNTVSASCEETKTQINLPTFSGSPEMVRDGVLAAQSAVARVDVIQRFAYSARDSLNAATADYSSKNSLPYNSVQEEPAAHAAPPAPTAAATTTRGQVSITTETPGSIEDKPVSGTNSNAGDATDLEKVDAGWDDAAPKAAAAPLAVPFAAVGPKGGAHGGKKP